MNNIIVCNTILHCIFYHQITDTIKVCVKCSVAVLLFIGGLAAQHYCFEHITDDSEGHSHTATGTETGAAETEIEIEGAGAGAEAKTGARTEAGVGAETGAGLEASLLDGAHIISDEAGSRRGGGRERQQR
jgi:hypothetical protein